MAYLIQQLTEIFEVINKPIFKIGDSGISISSLFFSIVIVFVSYRVAKVIGIALDWGLAKKAVDSGIRDSLTRFTRYGIIAIAVITALDTLGFSLNSLAALSAVLMVGIGFGPQNITQNFISGIILLAERPVKVGDIVHVGV